MTSDSAPGITREGSRNTSGDNASSSQEGPALAANPTHVLQQNPFAFKTYEGVIADAKQLALDKDFSEEDSTILMKGAALAKAQEDNKYFENVKEIKEILREDEVELLQEEQLHPWKSLSWANYTQASVCAGCAVVQGADQTIINGAQAFYFAYFAIGEDQTLLRGLVNGAPYIAASTVGCWVNPWLNQKLGRRWVLFLCCLLSLITALTQALSGNWIHFLVSRFFLGLAVGAKSATTPTYAAECAPKAVRGALVMQWQSFTAFGIMLGNALSIACQNLTTWGPNTQWRWMLGLTAIPPLVVMMFIFFQPESPRWYIEKSRTKDSFRSFCRLRSNKLFAARDFYSAHKHQEAQDRVSAQGWKKMFKEFKKPRNLRAAQGAYFVMIMQQFCGVNVLAYYSTSIFVACGFSPKSALLASLGCGVLNFVGALPAFFTIDRYGRRKLLLSTLPVLCVLLGIAAVVVKIENLDLKIGLILTTLYTFMFAYSPGMGPVPFTYSAEVFSLAARPLGMSSATSITWAFNFIINFTFPKMQSDMGDSGAFCFYAACNLAGWIYVYFFLPETKGMSLESLDQVFSRSTKDLAAEKWDDLERMWEKNILRRDVKPRPQPEYELSENPSRAPDEEAKAEGTGRRRGFVENREDAQADGRDALAGRQE